MAAVTADLAVEKALFPYDEMTKQIRFRVKQYRFDAVVEVVGKEGDECAFGRTGYLFNSSINDLHLVHLHLSVDAFVLESRGRKSGKSSDALNT